MPLPCAKIRATTSLELFKESISSLELTEDLAIKILKNLVNIKIMK
jgi:hypothetical protein